MRRAVCRRGPCPAWQGLPGSRVRPASRLWDTVPGGSWKGEDLQGQKVSSGKGRGCAARTRQVGCQTGGRTSHVTGPCSPRCPHSSSRGRSDDRELGPSPETPLWRVGWGVVVGEASPPASPPPYQAPGGQRASGQEGQEIPQVWPHTGLAP